ncbi:MAG: hypothetical protein J0L97_09365 [Alphaproteobacteria bacterium]|nr:hypothetical protein [Alphaproteobacteria bacterium]
MRIVTLLLAAFALAACTSETHELKSPCVGADGSPCVKRPVNGPLHG